MAERFPLAKENIHLSVSNSLFSEWYCVPVGTGVGRDQVVGQGL